MFEVFLSNDVHLYEKWNDNAGQICILQKNDISRVNTVAT